jgi:outer membrane protein assembly factor BamA
MNLTKFLHRLEYEKLKRDMVSRKVVALHLYVGQIFELPGNSLPVYGLQTLGNDTPLRGYSGSRFRDYTVAGVSAEYRFPVLRIMDGTLFDEYGVHGRSWQVIDYLSYKNSWGFGIRVRRPDIFLFRMDLGIHGISGVLFNMSVDAPF